MHCLNIGRIQYLLFVIYDLNLDSLTAFQFHKLGGSSLIWNLSSETKVKSYLLTVNRMDHFAGAEEHLAQQRLRQKLDEVNVAAQNYLAPIQDHVNFTLQKAYFKCAYECFDRSRRQEEITNCVENCSIPLANVQQTFDTEMQKFQVISFYPLLIIGYESAKLQQKGGAMNDMVSCADEAIQDSIKMLPLLANKLKSSFGIKDNDSF
ncbi:hypothetical protein Ahy_A05g021728 [Arachis hypogaea]|uniref:Protein FAM136A n=1 Tax=Arachis hypogaea TaxID=3818 RepID=A0A445CYE5_ARAHY|nr:hypothetical protein Ahy_A05g021728 [Arachis hypogaea]